MYLVRVNLADRPGALGAVASRIGAVRGDVIGLEILDRNDGRAVDEFVVELPDDAHVELLTSEIEEVDGAVVETVHPLVSSPGDLRRHAYQAAAALLTESSPEGALRQLVTLARRELGAGWAAVVDHAAATEEVGERRGDVAIVCSDGPAPAACWLTAYSLDLEEGSRLPAVELASAPLAAWDLVLMVGRPGRRFVQAERERLAALAMLGDARWAELSRARSSPVHPSRTYPGRNHPSQAV